MKTNSIMLKDMENSVLGVWVAHGEGKVEDIVDDTLEYYPVRYVDYKNDITTKYPENPNGSKFGIAGLCSRDGRHLAMMPHPERGVITWQNPWFLLNGVIIDFILGKKCLIMLTIGVV